MNIGFIDYYLDEWHANNYPRLLSEAALGTFMSEHHLSVVLPPMGLSMWP